MSRHVKLCHLRHLWDLALSGTERDWASGVCHRFKAELTQKHSQALVKASEHMALDILLPLFKVCVRVAAKRGRGDLGGGRYLMDG